MEATNYKTIRKLWTDYYSEKEIAKNLSLKNLISVEDQTLIPFPYCYTFYDMKASSLMYVSPNFKKIYALSPKEIYEGEHLPFEHVHIDEKTAVVQYIQRQWNTFSGSKRKSIKGRIACIENRICSRDGLVKHILHQNEVVGYTSEDKPRIVLSRFIDTSPLHRAADNRYVSYFVYNRETNEIEDQHKTLISASQSPRLTESEQKIQEMIEQGLTSKDIALKLDISVQTVRTHRKNIRSKQREVSDAD